MKTMYTSWKKKAGADRTKKEESIWHDDEINVQNGYMKVNRIQNMFVILKKKRHFVQKAMCFIQKDDGDIIHDSKFPRKLRPFMRICMHHVRITLYIVILII